MLNFYVFGNLRLKLDRQIMKNRKIIGNDIYGFEPYFNKLIVIASIYHEAKEVRPTHGYFSPHPHSAFSKKVAKKLGYNFNNN